MNKATITDNRIIECGEVPAGYKKTEFGVFPCDWATNKTLGDLFEFHGGLGKSREELSEDGTEYLHYGDMHQADFSIVSHEQYSHLPKFKTQIKGNESFLMRDGDVAFLDASEDLEGTSRAVLIDNPQNKPFIAGLHIILGRPKGNELEKYYKQYLTVSSYVKKQFQRLASGFKVYGLNKETLPQIRIAYPSGAKEQAKIAEILMAQERVIDLYGKKIEQLKKLKKIALQKMFPKRGSNVPEWRFPGFINPWEQRKLGDVLQTLPFKAYLKSPEQDGRYEIIQQGSDPIIGYANGEPCKDYKNTVIFGDHTLSLYKPKKPFFVATDGVRIVKGFENMDGNYLLSLLERNKPQSEGYKRYYSILADIDVFFTENHEEQSKIGEYFSELDDLITLHQRLQEEEKKKLKSLMRLLLTGIVRVKT